MVYCVSPFFFFSLSHYVLQPCSEEHVNTLSRLIAPRSSRASSFSPIRFCTYPEKAIRTCTHRVHALREDVCTSTWCFSPSMSSWREKICHRARKRTPLLCHCRRCRYLPDGHSTWQPAGNLSSGWAFHTADNSHRIACGQRESESRRPVRLILRRRGNGDVSTFSLTCVSRDQGRTSSLSLASINRKNRFTRPSLAVTSLCAYEAFFPTLFITEKVVKQFLERNQVVEEKR